VSVASRRRSRWSRFVVAGAFGALAGAAVAQPATAQCDIETDEGSFDVREADDPSDAIEVDVDSSMTVTRPGDGLVVVVVWIGPVPLPVPVPVGVGGDTVTVDLGDIDWLTVGLYRVDVVGPGAGECGGTFWLRITGRSPLTTVAGISAAAVAVAGGVLITQAARRGQRQRCSVRRGVLGGLVFGAGGSFLLQQFGVLPMLWPVIAIALLLPGLLGGLIARAFCVHAPAVRTLTPLLAAPIVVAAGERFELRAGVMVATPARRRQEREEVTVQIVAAGAEVIDDESWRLRLALGRGRAEATVPVRMRASRDVGASHLTAFYSVGGQTIGMARRPLWVVEPDGLPPPDVDPRAATVGGTMRLPVEQPPVDLELRATYAGPRALNVVQWTAESPHRERLEIPEAPVTVDLGSEPERFAAMLLTDVSEGEGRVGLAELLLGSGRQLARTIGASMIEVIHKTLAVTAPRPPRVLLLTEESSVPWELLAIEPAVADVPPFLATRAIVGRWFVAPGAPLPPPVTVAEGSRSVVATNDLPAAGSEARRLQAEFHFSGTPPTMAGVLNSLEDSTLVHLACHGSWRFDEGRCFLQLADGRLLPRHIAGLSLQQHPFVFLNACQVAAGGQALGTPTGFPAELVFAGAAGCITPLWSVRDDQAYEIAVAFYREVLAGRAPAELVRELRNRAAGTNLASSTPFAYQFCGHPDLRLTDAATRRAETA
jgi:CHAT domain